MIIAMMFALPGVVFAQPNVTVNAGIKGLKAGQWVYLMRLSNMKKDSVKAEEGAFQFKTNIPDGEGDLYVIQIGNGYKVYNGMMYADIPPISVYLDDGTVTIKGNGPGFKDAEVSGTASAEDLYAYSNLIENNLHTDELQEKEKELSEKQDTAGLKILQLQMDSVTSAYFKLTEQWVNEHPNSPVSAFLIGTILRAKLSFEELEVLLNKLSPSAKNNPATRNILQIIETNKLKLTDIGKIAPDFIQNDTLGNPVALKNFRGKYVLIDFWASWCTPCREENPNVLKAFNAYKSKNFTVLGISLDGEKNEWLNAIRKDGLIWEQVSDLKGRENTAGAKYDITAIPSNFLIDPDGKIIAKNLYGEDLQKKLEEVLKQSN
jgi:peroxiredoxin